MHFRLYALCNCDKILQIYALGHENIAIWQKSILMSVSIKHVSGISFEPSCDKIAQAILSFLIMSQQS